MEENKKSVPVYEQETHISYMRDEGFAKIYTSDSTQITRLDKLCKNSPDTYELIEDTGYGKKYLCKDKSLVSFRQKKVKREMTEEQRKLAGERLREIAARKKERLA